MADGKKTIVLLNAKSKFQKEKEAKEAKAKAEQEAAAAVYQSFLASFNEDEDAPKAFVSAGSMQDAMAKPSGGIPAGPMSIPPKVQALPPGRAPSFPPSDFPTTHLTSNNLHAKRPRREMDLFLEEIKQKQEKEAEHGAKKTTSDDPNTSNLFVANIAPHINEDYLRRIFGKYGPIQSVKILWPRSAEETRKTNSGFVNFVHRLDAEAAMDEMADKMIDGFSIFLSWARKVGDAGPVAGADKVNTGATVSSAGPSTAPLLGSGPTASTPTATSTNTTPQIHIKIPASEKVRKTIDLVATTVVRHGSVAETALLKECRTGSSASNFLWLYDPTCSEHQYYRWRVYSLLQGDTLQSWRTAPFKMQENGILWVPPLLPPAPISATSQPADATDDSRGWRGKNKLKTAELAQWQTVLAGLSLERLSIGSAMAFALDHASCAKEVVEILLHSMEDDRAPAPLQVARLFLVSDLLHNSSAPIKNASLYRSALQTALPNMFERLGSCYRSISGRFTSEAMRDRVMRVVLFWERTSIFPPIFLSGLEATFFRRPEEEDSTTVDNLDDATLPHEEIRRKCAASGLSTEGSAKDMLKRLGWLAVYVQTRVGTGPTPAATAVITKVAKGRPAAPAKPADKLEDKVDAEDIDGIALSPAADNEDVDGIPLDDAEGQLAGDDEDVDGVPLEDDVDGVPLS